MRDYSQWAKRKAGKRFAGSSGEGSRGGHVIGHTKSGKPIYETREGRDHHSKEAERHRTLARDLKADPATVKKHISAYKAHDAARNAFANLEAHGSGNYATTLKLMDTAKRLNTRANKY